MLEVIFNNIANFITKSYTLGLVQTPQGTSPSYQLTKWSHTTMGYQEIHALRGYKQGDSLFTQDKQDCDKLV